MASAFAKIEETILAHIRARLLSYPWMKLAGGSTKIGRVGGLVRLLEAHEGKPASKPGQLGCRLQHVWVAVAGDEGQLRLYLRRIRIALVKLEIMRVWVRHRGVALHTVHLPIELEELHQVLLVLLGPAEVLGSLYVVQTQYYYGERTQSVPTPVY